MAMKWSAVCLVAVAMLGCLCDAQWPDEENHEDHHPQVPEQPSTSTHGQNYPPPRPAQPYPQHPAQPFPQHPAQPYPQHPAQPYPPRPAQPFPQKPAQPFPQKPAQPYPQKPAQPFPPRPAQPFPPRPAQPFPPRPAQPFPPRPAQPFPQRPAQPFPPRPAQPFPPRPAQPFPPRPAQPYPQKPAQPYPQKPAQPYPQKPAQPYPQRPNQPYPQKPANPVKYPVHNPVPVENPEQTCEVEENSKVTCGLSDITAEHCHAISCCHDGRKCYYGKAVTVQCTKDGQFVVVVARDATVPNLELDSIHLLAGGEAHCSPIGTTNAFAIYQFKVTECGTVVSEEHDTIIYENRMSSSYEVGIGPYGAITRDSHYDLLFQCRYTGTSVETLAIEVSQPLNPLIVIAEAALSVELRLANGHCLIKGCNEEEEAYSSYYTAADYPITKILRDPVYAEVRILGMTDPNVVLMLEQCWATTTPNPNSLPHWDLLVDGCAYKDDRYLTNPVSVSSSSILPPGAIASHYKRFVFKMFTFVDPTSLIPMRENVYIHCSTNICHRDAGNCEQACYRQKREVSAEGQKRTKSEVVSSQQVIMIDQPISA